MLCGAPCEQVYCQLHICCGLELAVDTRGVLLPQFDLSASFAYNDAEILANRNVPASVGRLARIASSASSAASATMASRIS